MPSGQRHLFISFRHKLINTWWWLSSEMLHSALLWICTNVSDAINASIIRAIIAPMMEAVRMSETSVNIKQTMQHYIPEVNRLYTRRCESLKSQILGTYADHIKFWAPSVVYEATICQPLINPGSEVKYPTLRSKRMYFVSLNRRR